MLNMSQINDIRDLYNSGYKISEIHKKTGADPKTIRKYLSQDDFSESPETSAARPSVLDPFKPTILKWLEEDKLHWKKQHHTAKRVYDRLVEEEGYTGSYETVQRFMKKNRSDVRNRASQELIWDPGYAEVDFGEADFYEDTHSGTVRRKYLVVSFPYSNDAYVQLFGGETAECVCQGLEDIFTFIGGVPPVLIFDNATGVGHRVHGKVTETQLFQRFRAHYRFRIRFCNPESGWEKGNVENKVGTVRRNLFVPAPHYHDIIGYNRELLQKHVKKANELHYKKQMPISELFEEDRKHFLDLPVKDFNVCRYEWFTADGYGKVCMDGKHYYSTKPENHNQKVLVGIRAHYIDILKEDGSFLVRHRREFGKQRTDTSDYSTTLSVLSRNAGAWNNSGVRRDIPDPLREYMDHLEKPILKSRLRLMKSLNEQYGYQAAVDARNMALKNGNVNESDAKILAARITGYGIDTPPEAGPSLKAYDEAFLPSAEGGEAS